MATTGNQSELRLTWGVTSAPANAPDKVVRQIDSEAQALRVSIVAGHHKLDFIAACVGKSRSYVSRLQSGERPIPDRLVGPLCAATGSNLLRQYMDLQRVLNACDTQRLVELMRATA